LALATKGIKVLLVARSEKLLSDLQNEINNSGGFAKAYPADLCKD